MWMGSVIVAITACTTPMKIKRMAMPMPLETSVIFAQL
jgi:hypothetical protein